MDPRHVFISCSLFHMLALGMICTGAYVPFMLKLGLELADIQRINIVFFLTIFFLEIPTGALADGKSRRWSVTAGYLAWMFGMACYSQAQGFWSACLAESINGIGVAFVSGAFDAWLRDSLNKRHQPDEYLPTKMYAQGAASLGMIIGGTIGNLISAHDPRLAWICASGIMLITTLIARFGMDNSGEVHVNLRITPTEAVRQSVQALRSNPHLRWIALASMTYGLVLPFNHYWAPFFEARWSASRLDIIWLIMQGSLGIVAVTSRLGWWKNVPKLPAIAISLMACGASLALTGNANGILGPLFWTMIHEMARGLYKPQLDDALHLAVKSEWRATAGSLQSTIQTLGWAGILLGVSWGMAGKKATDTVIGNSWIISGSLLTISGLFLYLTRPRLAMQPNT